MTCQPPVGYDGRPWTNPGGSTSASSAPGGGSSPCRRSSGPAWPASCSASRACPRPTTRCSCSCRRRPAGASGCSSWGRPPSGRRAGCRTTSPAWSSGGWWRGRSCPTDSRGAFVVLTDAGRRAIEAAAPQHVEHVRRLVRRRPHARAARRPRRDGRRRPRPPGRRRRRVCTTSGGAGGYVAPHRRRPSETDVRASESAPRGAASAPDVLQALDGGPDLLQLGHDLLGEQPHADFSASAGGMPP